MNAKYTGADDDWETPVAPLLNPCLDAVLETQVCSIMQVRGLAIFRSLDGS